MYCVICVLCFHKNTIPQKRVKNQCEPDSRKVLIKNQALEAITNLPQNPRQPNRNPRPIRNQPQRHQLNNNKRHHPLINLRSPNFNRRNPPQIKQSKSKRRSKKRSLQIDSNHNTQPDGVDAHGE